MMPLVNCLSICSLNWLTFSPAHIPIPPASAIKLATGVICIACSAASTTFIVGRMARMAVMCCATASSPMFRSLLAVSAASSAFCAASRPAEAAISASRLKTFVPLPGVASCADSSSGVRRISSAVSSFPGCCGAVVSCISGLSPISFSSSTNVLIPRIVLHPQPNRCVRTRCVGHCSCTVKQWPASPRPPSRRTAAQKRPASL